MRFGFWPNPRSDYKSTRILAQHAETTGWDGIWLADHFLPEEDALIPVHESWITLAALARDIPRVRLGTLVTGNTYRHPAVLANMVATLDNLADGRVVLGLGAGWQQNEHDASGIEYGTVSSRLDMLEEACQVLRGLFQNDYFNFDGQHYQLKNAPLEPKPQQAKIPLMIGGGGEQRRPRHAGDAARLRLRAGVVRRRFCTSRLFNSERRHALLGEQLVAAGRLPLVHYHKIPAAGHALRERLVVRLEPVARRRRRHGLGRGAQAHRQQGDEVHAPDQPRPQETVVGAAVALARRSGGGRGRRRGFVRSLRSFEILWKVRALPVDAG